jgi:fatty-acyl-CoA synthase
MLGQMQEWPLLIHKIIDFAGSQHGDREVVSRLVEGPIHRIGYRDLRTQSLKLAQRLALDGIKLGDRVATLAWNTHRHLEAWYGITRSEPFTIPLTRGYSPTRSLGSSTMPKIG